MRFSRPAGKVHPLTPRVVWWTRAFFVAVPSVIILVGVFFVVMGTREWLLARECAQWPSVMGSVTSSKVVRSSHHSKGSTRHSYSPHVEYAYKVEGRSLSGERVSFRVRSEGEAGAREAVDRYVPGAPVQVWYDPADPARSVLETGDSWANAIPVGVGLFAIGFCSFFIHLAVKITRRMREQLAKAPSADERNELPAAFTRRQ